MIYSFIKYLSLTSKDSKKSLRESKIALFDKALVAALACVAWQCVQCAGAFPKFLCVGIFLCLFLTSLIFLFSGHYGFLLRLCITAGGVASVGERPTFSSPDENARAGETAPKFQCQPTLATPLVVCWALVN